MRAIAALLTGIDSVSPSFHLRRRRLLNDNYRAASLVRALLPVSAVNVRTAAGRSAPMQTARIGATSAVRMRDPAPAAAATKHQKAGRTTSLRRVL